MYLELPKTKDEYLKFLKMAFLEGQRSIEGELKSEPWGDGENYASTKANYNFETWANKKWKYGKIQLHLLNDNIVK